MSPVPTSISSNSTGLAYAEEASLKTLPGSPIWYGLEPNTYAELGANLSLVARTPITNTRQQAKGTITDLDAKAGFNTDLTQRNLTRLMQGFFFADAIEKPATNPLNGTAVPFTSVSATQYLAAAGLGVFKVGNLGFAKNFTNSGNNGLFKITAAAAGALTTDKALTVEAAPPAAASVEAVGFEFAAGDATLAVAANLITLGTTTTDLTTLGFTVGEWMYVGGDAAGTQFALNAPFFARVKSIAAHAVVFDLTNKTVVADAGATKTVRIFFGKVIANAANPANIKRRTYQLERQLGNDGVGTQSEIVVGTVPNELTLNLAQAAKATVDLTFVGLDVQFRTGTQGVLGGTRVAAPGEDAYNTALDVVMMELAIIDPTTSNPTGLFGFASDMKLTINNGVTVNKALGVLGGFDANAGNFAVSGTATAYFATVAGAAAVRANNDICMTTILAKKNYGMVLDIPLLALGNGSNKVEKDKPVMVDLTTTAAMNPNGYTALATFFEYLPTVAMPV